MRLSSIIFKYKFDKTKSICLWFISVLVAGFLSGFDKFSARIVGLIVYYALWFILIYAHTIIFKSEAIMGLFAIEFSNQFFKL